MSSGQDLNSLSRFRKQAERLILEEHGHCEVPAGCGGVVLRWRNPLAARPLTLHLYTPLPAACFLDGAEVRTGRVDLAPGRHAVTFALENVNLSAGLILFAAVHHGPRTEPGPPLPVTELPLRVLTIDDGSWKCSLQEPPTDDWKVPAFDDRDWLVLTRAPTPQLDPPAPGAYVCGECVRQGAACLGLPAPARQEKPDSWWQRLRGQRASSPTSGSVWIRKVFDIPPPQLREP
jgi:hypothetical protein